MQTSEQFSLPPFVRDHLTLNREKGKPTERVIFFIHQNTYLIIIQNPYVLLASSSSIHCTSKDIFFVYICAASTNQSSTNLPHQQSSIEKLPRWQRLSPVQPTESEYHGMLEQSSRQQEIWRQAITLPPEINMKYWLFLIGILINNGLWNDAGL